MTNWQLFLYTVIDMVRGKPSPTVIPINVSWYQWHQYLTGSVWHQYALLTTRSLVINLPVLTEGISPHFNITVMTHATLHTPPWPTSHLQWLESPGVNMQSRGWQGRESNPQSQTVWHETGDGATRPPHPQITPLSHYYWNPPAFCQLLLYYYSVFIDSPLSLESFLLLVCRFP